MIAPAKDFTWPVKEALVFVSNTPIDSKSTSRYDDMRGISICRFVSHHLLASDFRHLKSQNCNSNQLEPVAFLSCRNTVARHHFRQPVSCAYIMIKLLRASEIDLTEDDAIMNMRRHHLRNIDVQLIAFQGFLGKQSLACGQLN
jgi:hypothetical protein